MYNLYVYEKQLLKDEKEKNELVKKKTLKEKRKKELIKLKKKYDNRMNDFILTMCQNPIILSKHNSPFNKNKDIIKFKNNHFTFGYFKTDKERVESIEEEKKILKKYEEKREKDEKKRNISKIKNHRSLMIIQPKMRFNSRTKLENIIEIIKKKEENSNIDIYNNSIMEQMKKLKYNDVKKIKEYNNLIDKEQLNKEDLKEIIKFLNYKEQCENNNEYTLKNYINWKYLGILDNDEKINKDKSQPILNYNNINEILINIGNKKKNKEEKKNEFECLIKDDFKTHFKGASQYIELKDIKNIENEIQNDKKNNFMKKRAISAFILTNNKSMNKHFLSENQNKNNNFEHINKNDYKHKVKKRPVSVINNKYKDNDFQFLKNKNNYSIKDLSEEFKMKKILMKNMMNKEINNSIMKHYINKYTLISGLNKPGVYNPVLKKNYYFEEKSEELKEKLGMLQEEITKQKRIRNKDRYKLFVKRFAISTFGFRKKEILKKLDDFKDKKCDFVVIDGKVYQKKDMKNITDIIFQKCNYYNKKSEHNDSSLVKNNGKLMFTSGLTVSDFSSKYHL